VLGFLVQLLAMRLGIVTRKHLARHCREVYPPVPRILLWLMVEIAIIGSDIQEVIGSAIAIQLLTGGRVPLWQGVLITSIDTFFLLFLERLGVRKLETFFGVLVATMTVSFGVMYSKAHCPTGEVLLGTVLPRINSSGGRAGALGSYAAGTGAEVAGRPGLVVSAERCGSRGSGGGGPGLHRDPRELGRRRFVVQRDGGGSYTGAGRLCQLPT
jgi:Mn2+/Fe2+ NRAMP family transporter